jgi:hypothetical protein
MLETLVLKDPLDGAERIDFIRVLAHYSVAKRNPNLYNKPYFLSPDATAFHYLNKTRNATGSYRFQNHLDRSNYGGSKLELVPQPVDVRGIVLERSIGWKQLNAII